MVVGITFPDAAVFVIDVAPDSAATVPAKPPVDHDGRFAVNGDADEDVGREER